ncbi:MAG: ATP-binding protein [Chthoniobacterales bacterium]
MKAWPLRWKIAFYAGSLGVIATLAGACTTWLVIRSSEMAAFDRRLTTEAHELFRDVENFRESRIRNPSSFNQNIVPLASRDRLIEVRGANKELLYSSPDLRESMPDDGIDKIHTARIGGVPMRVGVFHENGMTLRIAADFAEVNRVGREIIFGMCAAIPTVLIVVVLGGYWVARRALAPVEEIRHAAENITAKTLDQRLPVPPAGDEIGGLVGVLNKTLDRLQRSFEQCVRFSAEASHHLKTPLAVLRAGIEQILTDPQTPAKQQTRAADLLHQVHQLTSIAENLLLLAQADAGRLDLQFDKFDLHEVLDGVCDDARVLADEHALTLETKLDQHLPLVADRASVALIVQNLIENAVKHNAPGGRVCIDAHSVDGEIELSVRNNGEPIPADRAPHIFERFYRARPDGRNAGAGLGLSIACELSKANRGSLDLVRSDTKWTEFRLRLPHAANKH